MSGRLLALAEVLEPVLAAVTPVGPVRLPAAEAIGLALVEPIAAPRDVPERAVALRGGVAVASLDVAGASAHAPVMLTAPPVPVKAGDGLPPGCDAVLDPAALTADGPFCEVGEPVEPGAHVRLSGHDLAAGEVIAQAGTLVTPEIALAASVSGVALLPVRRVDVALIWPDDASRAWLAARLARLGVRLVGEGDPRALSLTPAPDGPPRLALRPAETAWVRHDGDGVTVELPKRFDGVVGGWCALCLPVIASLSGSSLAVRRRRLTRKLVSAVGLSEVALLSLDADAATPLAVGDLPLSAIARATAFSMLPPGLEGYSAGSTVPSVRLDQPFGPLPTHREQA